MKIQESKNKDDINKIDDSANLQMLIRKQDAHNNVCNQIIL